MKLIGERDMQQVGNHPSLYDGHSSNQDKRSEEYWKSNPEDEGTRAKSESYYCH